jgi:hypothetical protein
MAGYSTTPLAKKLGIKSGYRIKLLHEPSHYTELFSDFPNNVTVNPKSAKYNFIHAFFSEKKLFEKELPKLKKQMEEDGMIWISWPKKSSGVETDLSENLIRETALAAGLVDVKICAVDEIWSGLKLVKRLKDRKK